MRTLGAIAIVTILTIGAIAVFHGYQPPCSRFTALPWLAECGQ